MLVQNIVDNVTILIRILCPIDMSSVSTRIVSNSTNNSSKWLLLYSLVAHAILRNSSHSGTSLLSLSRFALTSQSVSSCHAACFLFSETPQLLLNVSYS